MRSSKVVLRILSSVLSILFVLLILFGVIRAGEIAYDFGYRIFTEPAMEESPGKDVTVRVEEDMSGMELGRLLEQKKLVDDGVLFSIQLRLSAYSDKIKSGTYTLNTSLTAREMMQIMAGDEEEAGDTEENTNTENDTNGDAEE